MFPQALRELDICDGTKDSCIFFPALKKKPGKLRGFVYTAYQDTGCKRIERAAEMTYWEFDEAVARFQRILELLGINRALQEAGVRQGDTVRIGEYELEWKD